MTRREVLKAWQCIGCGRVEAPQTCVGVCEDRRVEFVRAGDYDALEARLREAERRAQSLEGLVRQLLMTTPREGAWERSYRALQQRARALIAGPTGRVEAPKA